MNVFGVMVTRNEAHRYLAESVASLCAIADAVLVFDDCSEDDTVAIAEGAGATVVRTRSSSTPSFAENERRFRWAAWNELRDQFYPASSDWIISQDADEFVVSEFAHPAVALRETIRLAEDESCKHIELPVLELFGRNSKGALMARTDGDWSRIRARRACEFPRSLEFIDKASDGSLPTVPGPMFRHGDPIIVHAGYLREADRKERFARYSTDRQGHLRAHIKSIVQPGRLEPMREVLVAGLPDIVVKGMPS